MGKKKREEERKEQGREEAREAGKRGDLQKPPQNPGVHLPASMHNDSPRTELSNFNVHTSYLGILLKMQILTQVWGGTYNFAFLLVCPREQRLEPIGFPPPQTRYLETTLAEGYLF